MTTPEFYTTGAPASALSVKVEHYLNFEGVDIFEHATALTTLNKLETLITDPIGTSPEAKLRISKLVKEAQDAMAPVTTKTELWGDEAVAYLFRKWREAFIDAIMIGRCIKVTNNDYSKFSVDNVKELSFRLAGLAAGQEVYVRDNMDKIVNTYVDLCAKLESICVPYWKQLTDIFELYGSFFVDTDPEKKLPSLLAAYPSWVMSTNLSGATVQSNFFTEAGNTMTGMLAHFEALIDAMSVIVVDGKNYASDLKTALAKTYRQAPIKKGFFVEYISKPLAWYAHKLKASQFRNASILPMTSISANLGAGTFSTTVDASIKDEIKCCFDKVIVDLYTDSSWKDFSKALAAQELYCPLAKVDNTAVAIQATAGIIALNLSQYLAADTYSDTITTVGNFASKWIGSHSSIQDTATKGLRAWMSYAQCYSDMPLEFANHHDETWFTGKIDDLVELNKGQRESIINLLVSCMVRIKPKDAMEALSSRGSDKPKEGKGRRSNSGKKN